MRNSIIITVFSIAIFSIICLRGNLFAIESEIYYQYLISNNISDEGKAIGYFYNNKKMIDEKIRNGIVQLYKREYERKVTAWGKLNNGEPIPEGYDIYFSREYYERHFALCSLAVDTGDNSIIDIVVDRCQMEELLVSYGDLAIEPVIKKLEKSQNTTEKVNQLRILQELVRPKEAGYVAKGEKREMAKGAIMRALKSDDISVSLAAARAIAATEDEDVLPILEEIARKSSDYLAKEAAQKGIAKIRGKSGEHKPTTPPGLTNKPTPPGQEKKQ